jgi:hypothetical protein
MNKELATDERRLRAELDTIAKHSFIEGRTSNRTDDPQRELLEAKRAANVYHALTNRDLDGFWKRVESHFYRKFTQDTKEVI